MQNNTDIYSPFQVCIYIHGKTSLYALGSIQEPFNLFNQISGFEKYQLSIINENKNSVSLNNNLMIEADYSIDDDITPDLLVILSEYKPEQAIPVSTRKWLQRLYHQTHCHFMTINAGTYWLADAGLINDKPVTLHWNWLDDFSDTYEQSQVKPQLYTVSSRINTCAGMAVTLDCILNFLEKHEGSEAVSTISEWLCIDRVRLDEERQRIPLQHLGGDLQPRLTMAVELMEQHLEEPLSTDQIAEAVNISRRQLERLFKRYLNNMPAKFYLELRLKKSKQLLLNSSKSIIQIGLMCGFSSGPHFSSAYKSYFGLTPREERNQKFIK